jgi:D-3-phosphoglycerate dehydrogenase
MAKVLVTPRSLTRETHPAIERLKNEGFKVVTSSPGKRPTEEELLKLLPGCNAYLAGVEPIKKNVLEKAHDLKVISRNGVGIDNIDLEAAETLGIKIETTPGANSRGVAELTVGLLFSLLRSIPTVNTALKNSEWKRIRGKEIDKKSFGIIGCGHIGKFVATMLGGLGMKVLGYDVTPDRAFVKDYFSWVSFEEVIANSDIISLHCPPTESPIINSDTIHHMKDGVYIINTARPELVEEEQLLKAIDKKKVAGFASDVLTEETGKASDLLFHPNVIATPHIGGYTEESIYRAADEAVANILKFF